MRVTRNVWLWITALLQDRRNQFSSVVQSCPILCNPVNCNTPGLPVHHQLPELMQTDVHQVSDVIQPSHPVVPFSSHFQSFPALGSFQMSQFLAPGGQSTGGSASVLVLPKNIHDWFPLGWTGWISLQSKGLSRVPQHHSYNASILHHSAFCIVQLSHPYMTTALCLRKEYTSLN